MNVLVIATDRWTRQYPACAEALSGPPNLADARFLVNPAQQGIKLDHNKASGLPVGGPAFARGKRGNNTTQGPDLVVCRLHPGKHGA